MKPRPAVLLRSVVALLLLAAFAWLAAGQAWFNDDAFITFRYARHLAEGAGYVWNPGGPAVEGSTSLGWTLLNAAAVRAGLDPLGFSHVAGLLAGILGIAVVIVVVPRMRIVGGAGALLAAVLLATHRQWIVWSVSGMETVAAATLQLLATLCLLHEARSLARKPGPLLGATSGVLFLLATVLRPETPLLHAAAGAGCVLAVPRRDMLRLVLRSGAVHAAGLLAIMLWRLATFGQPLPNPFYVKVGALQIARGVRALVEVARQTGAWLGVLLVLVAVPALWRHRRLEAAALGLPVLGWTLWSVAIGAGRWEFRFIVPVLPAACLLLALAVSVRLETPIPSTAPPAPDARWRLRRHAARWTFAAAALALVGLHVASLRTPFRPFGDVLSREQSLRAADYMAHEAQRLAPYLGPDTRIATGWSGVLPYLTRAWHFDPWGLNDRTIARRPMQTEAILFHQRHARWEDIVEHRVLVCDVFNHFLFPRPYRGERTRAVVPWVEPGIDVYSVRFDGSYWIFASARPRAEVAAWLHDHDLQIATVVPLPDGLRPLGTPTQP